MTMTLIGQLRRDGWFAQEVRNIGGFDTGTYELDPQSPCVCPDRQRSGSVGRSSGGTTAIAALSSSTSAGCSVTRSGDEKGGRRVVDHHSRRRGDPVYRCRPVQGPDQIPPRFAGKRLRVGWHLGGEEPGGR